MIWLFPLIVGSILIEFFCHPWQSKSGTTPAKRKGKRK